MNKKNKGENGQIIILLAVSLIVVIMVAALAVDGGMIYSERRFAQNAADSASLSGGGSVLNYMELVSDNKKTITGQNLICSDAKNPNLTVAKIIDKAQFDAIQTAEANNITNLSYLGMVLDGEKVPNDLDLDFKHGVIINCVSGQYMEVVVRITSKVSTAFAHLIYKEDLITTTEAITRAVPHGVGDGGYALVSLSENCANSTDGMEFNNSSTGAFVNIKNGKIHSNSCFKAAGNGLDVTATYGIFSSMPEGGQNATSTENFSFTGGVEPIALEYPEEPDCEDYPDGEFSNSGGVTTYNPGNYSSISISSNGDFKFNPGLYCITDSLSISGNNKTGVVSGERVTFYLKSDATNKVADVSITGGKTVKLSAPLEGDPPPGDPYLPGIPGYLFYMSEDNITTNPQGNVTNRGTLKIEGNGDSYFSGIILAPKGNVEIGGTPSVNPVEGSTFTTRVIGWFVKVSGNATLDILYYTGGEDEASGYFFLER
jgi:hypothetical protein